MDKNKVKKQLLSFDINEIIEALNTVLSSVKENGNFSTFNKEINELLIHDNIEIRKKSAEILCFDLFNEVKDLFDDDAKVRRKISYYFREAPVYDLVRDRDERNIEYAIPALTAALFDKDYEVRSNAVKSLSAANNDRQNVDFAINGLIKLIKNRDNKDLIHEAVFIMRNAVENGYDIFKYENELKQYLNSSDDKLKWGIADTLTLYYANKEKIEKIRELLSHNDKDVVQETAGTIGHIARYKKNSVVSKLIPELLTLTQSNDDELSFTAVKSVLTLLKDFETLNKLLPKIKIFLNSKNVKLKKNAYLLFSDILKDTFNCKNDSLNDFIDLFEPYIRIFKNPDNDRDKDISTLIKRGMLPYYTHTQDWDEVKDLINKSSAKLKSDLIFQTTTCCLSDCKLDFNVLIKFYCQLYFKDKNENVKKSILNRLENFAKKNKKYAGLIKEEFYKNEITDKKSISLLVSIENSLNKKKLKKIKSKLDNAEREEQIDILSGLCSTDITALKILILSQIRNMYYLDNKGLSDFIPYLIKWLKSGNFLIRYKTSETLMVFISGYSFENYPGDFISALDDDFDPVVENILYCLEMIMKAGLDISKTKDKLKELFKHNSGNEILLRIMGLLYSDWKYKKYFIDEFINDIVEVLNDKSKQVRDYALWIIKGYFVDEKKPCNLSGQFKEAEKYCKSKNNA